MVSAATGHRYPYNYGHVQLQMKKHHADQDCRLQSDPHSPASDNIELESFSTDANIDASSNRVPLHQTLTP